MYDDKSWKENILAAYLEIQISKNV